MDSKAMDDLIRLSEVDIEKNNLRLRILVRLYLSFKDMYAWGKLSHYGYIRKQVNG
jgi:hypothetical protein